MDERRNPLSREAMSKMTTGKAGMQAASFLRFKINRLAETAGFNWPEPSSPRYDRRRVSIDWASLRKLRPGKDAAALGYEAVDVCARAFLANLERGSTMDFVNDSELECNVLDSLVLLRRSDREIWTFRVSEGTSKRQVSFEDADDELQFGLSAKIVYSVALLTTNRRYMKRRLRFNR